MHRAYCRRKENESCIDPNGNSRENTPGNIVHGLDLLQEAAANSDIAVLPEIWTTGYSLGRIEEEAETIDGSTIAAVRKIANDHHCAVVAGSIPLRHKDGKIYNNTVVIDKQGSVVASYSKVHLLVYLMKNVFCCW